jgi:cysteine-S-conjugate beta-lyase
MTWKTKLLNPAPYARTDAKYLTTPVYRGSTVVFDKQQDVTDDWRQSENGYTYGLYGTPTTMELAARLSLIEGAKNCFIVPGGQAAIAIVYLAYCEAGSHALVPVSAYGPGRELAEGLMKNLSIEVEVYDPLIGADIKDLIRDNTSLIWCESPGSVTMEVQDVPAIVAAANARGVPVALDNTYAAGILFDAYEHGVDVSIQALTKYIGGHSDLLLGSVSVRDDAAYKIVGPIYRQLGLAVSPDECSLALRGMQTLAVRLAHIETAALTVAKWLSGRSEIETVLHPALPSCPGHEFWKRDFKGSAGVFSILFQPEFSDDQVAEFVNALEHFKIGFSWAGVNSLAIIYPNVDRPGKNFGNRLVRLNIGLEEPEDLMTDLAQALNRI